MVGRPAVGHGQRRRAGRDRLATSGIIPAMSATLLARGLAAGHGARALFSGLDLVVGPGDVVGLVGVNGAGKSTLLRLLAGLDVPQDGSVRRSPPDAAVGYLPQELERRAGETILGHLHRRTGVADAQAALDEAAHALAASGGERERSESGGETSGGETSGGETALKASANDYPAALDRWLALGAADLDERIGVVLDDLGPAIDPATVMTSLSGGQAARVGLAALLLSRFDVLLLDEPTNDLDLDGLTRLERFVTDQRSGLVVVSHDREFLARCVTTVVELDLAQQQVGVYGGGYQAYLDERELGRQHARDAYEAFADHKAELQQRARTRRAWTEKGLRREAKRPRDPDKIGHRARVEQAEKQAAKARQTERAIERLTDVPEPRREWDLRYTISAGGSVPRSGAVVLTARGAHIRRGDFELGPLDLQVDIGDRIGITGPNGSGKSTLLALLLGRLRPDAGTVSMGAQVAVGEVDQARGLFAGPGSLLEVFAAQLPDVAPAEIRTLLAKFGLTADHVVRQAISLSPGERTRACLALLQAKGVNLLVLDEPTNHLDLPAIEQLERALDLYSGTVLLITHDRRMLDSVHLTRRWRVEHGTVGE